MVPVRADGSRDGATQTIHAADAVLLHFDVGQRAAGPIAAEDRHRVVVGAGDVDVVPVGAEGDRPCAVQSVHAADAVLLHLDVGQGAAGPIPAEDSHRVVTLARDVDVVPVGAEGDRPGGVQSVHAADAILLHLDEDQPACDRIPAEERHRVVTLGRDVDVVPVGTHANRGGVGQAVRLPVCPRKGQPSGLPVPAEDRHRVVSCAGDVDVVPVGADGDRGGPIQPIHAASAVPLHLDVGQPAGGPLAAEDDHRVVTAARDVDVVTVGADGDRSGEIQPVHAAHAVLLHFNISQRPTNRIPAEYRHRVVGVARGVDVVPVGADGDRARAVQAVDAADAVLLHLDVGQRAGRSIATEDGHRVVMLCRSVDVAAVGADGDPLRAIQTIHAADAVLLHFDAGQRAAGSIAAEDGHRVVVGAGDVDMVPVRADGDRHCAIKSIHTADAILVHLDVGQRAAGPIAAEDGHRVVEPARDVDVVPVGADGD